MKATSSPQKTAHKTTADAARVDREFERALRLLSDAGFDYEIVDRCPEPCADCDRTLAAAA